MNKKQLFCSLAVLTLAVGAGTTTLIKTSKNIKNVNAVEERTITINHDNFTSTGTYTFSASTANDNTINAYCSNTRYYPDNTTYFAMVSTGGSTLYLKTPFAKVLGVTIGKDSDSVTTTLFLKDSDESSISGLTGVTLSNDVETVVDEGEGNNKYIAIKFNKACAIYYITVRYSC